MDTKTRLKRIGIFGHFGDRNFGNESTLGAVLYHIRRRLAEPQIVCICTDPDAVRSAYRTEAISMNGIVLRPLWLRGNRLVRLLRAVLVGLPSEAYRWLEAINCVRRLDVLIVAGTGLLTDAYGLRNWGPYNLFKWCLVAKLCRCKLFFVSVGAGPIHGPLGRCLVRMLLALADVRSYRDDATKTYLRGLGAAALTDRVYPDLAFSLPDRAMPTDTRGTGRRRVVGVGLMLYDWKSRSGGRPAKQIYTDYLDNLATFVHWLLAHDHDVRLLIGDVCDRPVTRDFRALLKDRGVLYDEERVIDDPIDSVENLLSQLTMTDVVVATRFHNVLLALLLNKPVISITFHQKCKSLMRDMGLAEYCQDIKTLDSSMLIQQFCDLQRDSTRVKSSIKRRAAQFRIGLDEQYTNLFTQI
jgi:polysaccharide pyruvyl transferase WcaK-like protein